MLYNVFRFQKSVQLSISIYPLFLVIIQNILNFAERAAERVHRAEGHVLRRRLHGARLRPRRRAAVTVSPIRHRNYDTVGEWQKCHLVTEYQFFGAD